MSSATSPDGNVHRERTFSEVEDQNPPLRNNSYASIPSDDTAVPSVSATDETDSNINNTDARNLFTAVLDWYLELIALVVAFLSFGAIVAIVSAYHDEVQPEFTYSISINTLVAIFSTILRATLLFVISEVIGQSKWRWVWESPRPLRHIERFNAAGKGAWGSLKILFTMWRSPVASLQPSTPRPPKSRFNTENILNMYTCRTSSLVGAFVVIASYAIGPFSQQATTTYTCERITGTAKVAIARDVQLDFNLGGRQTPPQMVAAAITGLIFGGYNSSSTLFQCDTGNCTFDAPFGITHSSVGICNECIDTGNWVNAYDKGENGTNYGLYGKGIDGYTNRSITWPIRRNETYDSEYITNGFLVSGNVSTSWSILTFSAARCADENPVDNWPVGFRLCNQEKHRVVSATDGTPPGRDAGVVRVTCTWSPCVYHYNARVTNGVLKEDVVSKEPMSSSSRKVDGTDLAFPSSFRMIEPCFFRGNWYDRSNFSQAPMDGNWGTWGTGKGFLKLPLSCARALEGFGPGLKLLSMSINLEGTCQFSWLRMLMDKHLGSGIRVPPSRVLQKLACDSWLSETLYNKGNATQGSIKAAFDGMATAITNYMRTNNLESADIRDEPQAFVNGSATQTLICIRAEWQWLLYPGILLVLTTILLAEACIRSHRDRGQQPVWKSAILPLLFYGIKPRGGRSDSGDRDGGREAVPLLKIRELELLADRTVARFDGDKKAPGFVLEEDEGREEKGPAGSGQC